MTDGTATLEALYDECCRLIAENTHLRTQFEVSQGIADLAIQQRDQAIAERDVARAVNHGA
jgi:hypothetical protein